MVFQGTPQHLRASYSDVVNLATNRDGDARDYLSQLGWPVENRDSNSIHIRVNSQGDVAQINHQLVQAGFQVYQLNLSQPSLEDIFLMLTEKPIQQEI
jgi:ABC-type multidrug transport system ATPase subunit